MCIICNCSDGVGTRFLTEFHTASHHMKAAAAAMLECSKVATDKATAMQYDAAHKRMVKILREWNRIEHMREHAEPLSTGLTSIVVADNG